MLLPSALSCDGGRVIPSSQNILLPPAPRRAARIPPDYPSRSLFASPPANLYESALSSTIGGSAVEGIFSTCKKLHQILSLDANRSASTPSIVVSSAVSQSHNAFNIAISAPTVSRARSTTPQPSCRSVTPTVSAPKNARDRSSLAPCANPQTPRPRNANVMRIPKTPMRRNKRRREETDSEDDGFYHIPVQSNKRTRLTVPSPQAIPRTTVNGATPIMRATPSSRFHRRSRQYVMDGGYHTTPQYASSSSSSASSSASSSLSSASAPSSPDSLTPTAADMQLSLINSSPITEDEHMKITTTSPPSSQENPEWTRAEDRMLVELVLKKLRLSARDWADCARSLGRDPRAVGNRWDMIVGRLVGGGVRDGRVAGASRRKRLE